MKKSFLALLVSSVFLLSACDEKENRTEATEIKQTEQTQQTTQAPETVQPSEKVATDKLNAEIITLFEKGKSVDLDESTEHKFNPAEPFFLSVQAPKTGVQWLDNLLLIEAAKFMLPFDQDKPFPFTADQPNLKASLEAALATYYDEYAKEINESLAEMKKFDIEAGDATEQNWQPSPMMTSQYFNLESKFLDQQRNIATFFFYFENYTGGAHGWHTGVTVNADLDRQSLISVEDLFGKEYSSHKAVKDLLWESYKNYHWALTQEFAKDSNEPAPSREKFEAEFKENAFIRPEYLYISNSFQFTKEGIMFSYPPYVIGSYAEGQIELLVEWKDIQPLLTKEYQGLAEYEFKPIPKE